MGSVFQNPKSQFFNLDTTGQVLFGLESRGLSGGNVRVLDSAVQVCGVGPLLDRNIFALSGGRSSASPVPAHGPWDRRCLCWMSPSSNLDGEGIRQLQDILRRLKAAGKTVLVAGTVCGTLPTWLIECSICEEGGWSGSTPGRSSWLCRKKKALHGSAEFDGGACRSRTRHRKRQSDGMRPSGLPTAAEQSGRMCPLPHSEDRSQPLPVTTGRARPLWPNACAVLMKEQARTILWGRKAP